MLSKLLSFFLNSTPEKPAPSKIEEVTIRRSFPELQHIQLDMLQRMNRTIQDLEVFCTIVECLNEGLEDTRLESLSGTMQALKQLQEYAIVTRKTQTIVVNKTIPKQAKQPLIFFEV